MTDLESTPPQDQLNILRSMLTQTYGEIEEKASTMIREGKTVDNPILTRVAPDTRYSMAALVMVNGIADTFLGHATSALQEAVPGMRVTPDGFRHILLRDVTFNPQGRTNARIDAEAVQRYYNAIRKAFEEPSGSIQLELVKILPAIDKEQNSVSIVGAFLPTDIRIVNARTKVHKAIEEAGLPLTSRLGEVRVLFSTLGRLPHPPQRQGERIPLLEKLQEINSHLTPNLISTINRIDMLSTTPISYVWADKHVYMNPPISLTTPNDPIKVSFITARHKLALDKKGD